MTPIAAALTMPASRRPGRASPDEAEEQPPLPMLPGYRLQHAGLFTEPDDASPAVPVRSRVALRLAGCFVGAVVLEVSHTGGQSWQALVRDGEPLLKAAPGAICVGALAAFDGPAFARYRCLSLASGAIGWSLSTW